MRYRFIASFVAFALVTVSALTQILFAQRGGKQKNASAERLADKESTV